MLSLKGLAACHIHKDPLSGLIYTQLFPLFIYMGNHHMGMFNGVNLDIPHTAIDFFKFLGDIIVKYRRAARGQSNAKYRIYTRYYKNNDQYL